MHQPGLKLPAQASSALRSPICNRQHQPPDWCRHLYNSAEQCQEFLVSQDQICSLKTVAGSCRHPKSIDHTATQQQISNLIDEQQSLKRQLAFAKQQQVASAEAGSKARARSQHHAGAVVAAEECVRRCAQETARLQAQLAAQGMSEEHAAEHCEALESQVQGLQHQQQQAAAAEYRARSELSLSRSSLRATQHALHKEAAIIQSLEEQLMAEHTAAAVRAMAVRVRATMQARKAASAQAQQLAAQNAYLLADRRSLMQRLAALEQQRDGMLC